MADPARNVDSDGRGDRKRPDGAWVANMEKYANWSDSERLGRIDEKVSATVETMHRIEMVLTKSLDSTISQINALEERVIKLERAAYWMAGAAAVSGSALGAAISKLF